MPRGKPSQRHQKAIDCFGTFPASHGKFWADNEVCIPGPTVSIHLHPNHFQTKFLTFGCEVAKVIKLHIPKGPSKVKIPARTRVKSGKLKVRKRTRHLQNHKNEITLNRRNAFYTRI